MTEMVGDVNVEGTVAVAVGILAAILIIAGVVLHDSTLLLIGLVIGGILVAIFVLGSLSGRGH